MGADHRPLTLVRAYDLRLETLKMDRFRSWRSAWFDGRRSVGLSLQSASSPGALDRRRPAASLRQAVAEAPTAFALWQLHLHQHRNR